MENFTRNFTTSPWNISQLSAEDLKYSNLWTSLLSLAYTIIFILGFVGNTIVIIVIYSKREMRTVTNLFIFNLAVADLLVVVFCVPVTLLANIFIPWIFGLVICKVLSYAQGVSVFASVYSLVAISVERYRSLYSTIRNPNGFTRIQTKLIILLIWIMALFITSPWLLVFHVVYFDDATINLEYNYPICQENWSTYELLGKFYFVGVNLILCFFVPVIVIAVVNAIIYWNVKKYYSRQNPDQQLRYNINGINRELFIIIVAFVISWLPLYVLFARIKLVEKSEEMMDVDGDDDDNLSYNTTDILIPVAQLLGASNSCVNPLLYAFHNKKFRDTVSTYCQRRCRRRRRNYMV